MIQRNKSL